jgi:hypothetical protein
MQGKDLDGYIATFKHLAKEAGYCEEPTNGPFRYLEAQGDGAGSKCEQGLRGGGRSRMQ